MITANARDGYGLKAVKVNDELENAVNNQVSLVMPFGGIVVEPVIEQLYSVTFAENPDATTKRLQGIPFGWRSIRNLAILLI